MMKKLLRLLRVAPLALVFAGVASAQTTGTIIGVVTDASTGKPVAGAVVIATSPNLQGEQTAVTDGNGNYRITLLPAGEYKLAVQLEGYKPSDRSDIRLSIDKTLRANLAVVPEAVQIDEQVVRTGASPIVNIGSAESGSVVSSEFIAAIPLGRSFDQVALVAPTATADQYGVGFSGAQSPENAYVLDGLSVNDVQYGTVSTSMLSNFVQEVDVKTGNYSAEYGRATGGIVNVVTKSGSNEFHGSVFSNFSPNFLVKPDGKAFGNAGEAIASKNVPGEGDYRLDLGFEVGGPIMKDKLWFFAGFAPVITKTNYERFYQRQVVDADGLPTFDANGNYAMERIGDSTVHETSTTQYQFAAKLSYLIDENNSVAVSTYGSPAKRSAYSANSWDALRNIDTDGGDYDYIGKYAGKFLDKRLIVEALAGYHHSVNNTKPTSFQKNTPGISWYPTDAVGAWGLATARDEASLEGFEGLDDSIGALCDTTVDGEPSTACPVSLYRTGGIGFGSDASGDRLSGKLSASYLLEAFGSHNLKAGIDLEKNSFDQSKYYGGGRFYRARSTAGSATLSNTMQVYRAYGNVPDESGYDDTVVWKGLDPTESTATTDSFAYYLQDSWTLPNVGLTVNAGLRLETQSMDGQSKGGSKYQGFAINDSWSPRVQAIWDFTGTGRGKVAGSWGRFYYALPLDMGDRQFGNEQTISAYYQCTAAGGGTLTISPDAFPEDAAEAANCAPLRRTAYQNHFFTQQGAGTTPVDPNIEGSYVDQFGAQVEYELFGDLSVGIDYQGRRQGAVIEDMSADDGTTYFIANPNKGKPFTKDGVTYDPKNMITVDKVTGREITLVMPAPERSYDGITLRMSKAFSQNWLAQVSYTYSSLRGNYNGVFRPEDGQLDPGITSDYDLPALMANRTGYLSAHTPHIIKLFGAYNFKLSPKMNLMASGTFNTAAGGYQNALGAHPDYGTSQAFLVQRGAAGRAPWVTQLDLGGRFEYTITPPYAVKFSVDVFNVFNSQEVIDYDEDYTFDAVYGIANVKCDTKAVGSKNPIATIQKDCSQLAYLKTTDGNPAAPNPNFGKPVAASTAYQVPLSVRFGLALTF